MNTQTNRNLFISKINRHAVDVSYNKAKNHIYNTISVLGSAWTHIGILFLLDLYVVFHEDIVRHLKTRDYKKQMTRNSKWLCSTREETANWVRVDLTAVTEG